jgi:hypothetical protein
MREAPGAGSNAGGGFVGATPLARTAPTLRRARSSGPCRRTRGLAVGTDKGARGRGSRRRIVDIVRPDAQYPRGALRPDAEDGGSNLIRPPTDLCEAVQQIVVAEMTAAAKRLQRAAGNRARDVPALDLDREQHTAAIPSWRREQCLLFVNWQSNPPLRENSYCVRSKLNGDTYMEARDLDPRPRRHIIAVMPVIAVMPASSPQVGRACGSEEHAASCVASALASVGRRESARPLSLRPALASRPRTG